MKKTMNYQTPKSISIDLTFEGVLCGSQGESENDGYTIVDYDKVSGSWE